MTQSDRAKQFLPFDAMKGLCEALRDREERYSREERREIAGESAERIDRVLRRLAVGDFVALTCYSHFHTERRMGRVTAIQPEYRCLFLGSERVWFEDIYALRVLRDDRRGERLRTV